MSLILDKYDFDTIIKVPPEGVRMAIDIETPMIEDSLKKDKRIDKILIPEICLSKRINKIASEVLKDYSKEDTLNIVVVLSGGILFASDFSRLLYSISAVNTDFHFIKTSVYEGEIKKDNEEQREVKVVLPINDIAKKDILIVEDIVDQGFTLSWLIDYLKNEKNVNSVRTCVLLNKQLENPSPNVKQLRENLHIDYSGFYIPDRWVAGYGCDVADSFRNMPFIVTINEEYYK